MWSVWTSLSSWTIWWVNVQKVCSTELWSLFTGRLVWTGPVVIEKSYNIDSLLPSLGFNARWLNSWLEKRKGWQNQGVHCCAVFSSKEQLLVVSAEGLLVLDAKRGNTPCTFLHRISFSSFKFHRSVTRNALFLIPIQLFNIKSGKVQLMSRVRWPVCFLNRRLFAIGLKSAMPSFKTVFSVHLPRGEYTLSIFKRKWDVGNVFRNLLSHTRKRDKKEIAVQGAKGDKLGFTLQYTCIDKKWRPIQTWHFICAHFTLMGKR